MDWKGFKPISQIIKKKMTVNFNRKYKILYFNAAASEKMKGYVNIGIDFERKAIAIEPTERKEKYSIKLHKGKSCSRITRRDLFDRLEELIGHLDGSYDMRWMENEKCFVIQFGGRRK